MDVVFKISNIPGKEIDSLLERITTAWNVSIPKEKVVRKLEIGDEKYVVVSKSFMAAVVGSAILPILHDEDALSSFPFVTVDTGAVKHICNGANVMRPGIVSFGSDFSTGEVVTVKEQTYKKYIATGLSVMGRPEAESAARGVVVKNLHYVGDRIWDSFKEAKEKLLKF